MNAAKNIKPLGRKSYGSIAHLPGSRLGPGDHHCHPGQARICTMKNRDRHDLIIVQEKLDGSNVGIARIDGEIHALTRAGYAAATSPYEQHWLFARWVEINRERFLNVLQDGERLCGEWLLQAHATRYKLMHEPFVAFDIMMADQRMPFAQFQARIEGSGVVAPALIHIGAPISIEQAFVLMGEFGRHGALDAVEGCVWRVERRGAVDFLAKFVRPDKVDGHYLPEISGQPAVYNWQPDWLTA
jgi:hypothetical protein